MALMNFKLLHNKQPRLQVSQQVSKLVLHCLFFLVLVQTSTSQSCHRASIVTWHTDAATINISWSLDNVCDSYVDCYGSVESGNSGPIDHQICPVEIQINDRLVILPPSISSGSALPVNVTESEFYACPSDSHPSSQWLVSSSSTAPFEVDKAFLQEGRNFFAQLPTGDVFLTCELGLRVMVSVKSHDCAINQSEPICNGHGECVTMPFSPVSDVYTCRCEPSYMGQYCEEFDGCHGDPCQNGGGCVDEDEGDSGRNYMCNCSAGFTGDNCTDLLGSCIPGICGQGTCVTVSQEAFRCDCSNGFKGLFCEDEILECASDPCQHNATCIDEIGSFHCLCSSDYIGVRCEEERDYCLDQPCQNGANCSSFLGGYSCTCRPGFTDMNCSTNIDECKPNSCQNGAACLDEINNFRCECSPGYTGQLCETNIDECSSQPCQNAAQCIDLINFFYCICPPGYTGMTCSDDIDECVSSPCVNEGRCEDLVDGYRCICNEQLFGGLNCEIPLHNCSFYPCQQNGTCQIVDSLSYACLCPERYTGQNCESYIPFCNTHNCTNNATCNEELNSFTCQCPVGYTGQWCEVDIDYCSNHNCSNDASCVDDTTSYRCLCAPGFEGQYCEINTDECGSSPCANGGICVDETNSYQCVCPAGFTSLDCSLNIDECESSPCVNGGACLDGVNSYVCSCGIGFNGTQCDVDLDLCSLNICQNEALNCSETEGGNNFSCVCALGYFGQRCEIEFDECSSNPCLNDAFCLNEINSYQCYCLPGYVGDHCQFEIDECFSQPCLHNSSCVDLFNNYTCQCSLGYEGYNCEINIDDCAEDPCLNGGSCIDEVDNYSCNCTSGYEGRNCSEDFDECSSDPCMPNTTEACINGVNNFTCMCRSGFRGQLCEVNIDECEGHVCENNASCVDGINGYSCICAPGFTGLLCEVNIDECLSNPCNLGSCLDDINGYTCICPPDSRPFDPSCSLLPPCTSNPCQNNGTCQEEQDDYVYSCDCLLGFEGLNCEVNTDDCLASNVTCANGGMCIDLIGDFRCWCPAGFEGLYCEENLDDCIGNLCQFDSVCIDGVDGYSCNCMAGYTGVFCNVTILTCDQDPCLNEGTCLDFDLTTPTTTDGTGEGTESSNRMFQCVCLTGWEGVFCHVETDECASNPCLNAATCVDFFAGYVCECSPGFTGEQCEVDIDECINNDCARGSTCIDGILSYTCQCQEGYEGRLCEQEIDECLSSPCNPATSLCVDLLAGYRCFCLNGWAGPNCDINVDECLSEPCQNQGTCLDGIADVTCLCLPGFTGKFCEIEIDECGSVPCHNNGECLDDINGYTCFCIAGFTGLQCEININECASNPCLRGGTCLDDINSYQCLCPIPYRGDDCSLLPCQVFPCENNANCTDFVDDLDTHPLGFFCACNTGFMGQRCEVNINDCSPDSCSSNGLCIDGILGYSCLCEPGWAGRDCSLPIDDCVDNMCQNNSTCEDLNQAYRCLCIEGFEGNFCEIETDECSSDPCVNGATCIDHFNRFECVCVSGWMGTFCDQDIDECDSNPCQNGALCLNGPDRFRCDCQPFFTGTYCNVTFDPCDPGFNQCQNNATCITRMDGSYQCACIEGFEGYNCEVNTNECSSSPCLNGAPCFDEIAGYQCFCLIGFRGTHCEENINDCRLGVCANGGTCIDGINGFTCDCIAGWNGDNCTDNIDECQSDPCVNGATCLDQLNSFECVCVPGYTGSRCEGDIKECLSDPCLNGATCVDEVNQYQCICVSGFTGVNCQDDIDDCFPPPCNNGSCIDEVNGYRCECNPGYQGVNCTEDVNECESSPCMNGGQCNNLVSGYTCTCVFGYTGINCELDVDVCMDRTLNVTQCQNGATCLDGQGPFFTCLCTPGFTGFYCETDIDECSSSPCENEATCIDLVAGFSCTCAEGWTGVICEEDIDECLSSLCMNGALCQQRSPGDGYDCFCAPGFQGILCEVDYDECLSAPCQNSATCVDSVNGYDCICRSGFTGVTCEMDIDECLSDPCLNNGTCNQVEPGVLICECRQGFFGTLCESVDYCFSQPCANGAFCITNAGGFQCFCSAGFTGVTCETRLVTTSSVVDITSSNTVTVESSVMSGSLPISSLGMMSTQLDRSSVQTRLVTISPTSSVLETASLSPSMYASSAVRSESAPVSSMPMTSELSGSNTLETGTISLTQTTPMLSLSVNSLITPTPVVSSTIILLSSERLPVSSAAFHTTDFFSTDSSIMATPSSSSSNVKSTASELYTSTPLSTMESTSLPFMSTASSVSQSGVLSSSLDLTTTFSMGGIASTLESTPSISSSTPATTMESTSVPLMSTASSVSQNVDLSTSLGITSTLFTPSMSTPQLNSTVLPSDTITMSSTLSPVIQFTLITPSTQILMTSSHGMSVSSVTPPTISSFSQATPTLMTSNQSQIMMTASQSDIMLTSSFLAQSTITSQQPPTDSMPTLQSTRLQTSSNLASPSLSLEMSTMETEISSSLTRTRLQTSSSLPMSSILTTEVVNPSNFVSLMSSTGQMFSTEVTSQLTSSGTPTMSSLPLITSSEIRVSTTAGISSSEFSTLTSDISFPGLMTPSMIASMSSMMVTATPMPTPQMTTPQSTPTSTMEPSTTASPPSTCETSPCLNGGVCRNQTSGGILVFECDCPFRFSGSLCEIDQAVHFPSFSGNSYLKYASLDWSASSSNSIFITIKTSATEGTVLYSASDDSSDEFIHLFIQDGSLVYEMGCGLGQVVRVESSVGVATDKLVEVLISQTRPDITSMMCGATLTVNNDVVTNQIFSFIFPLPLGPLYLGGSPEVVTSSDLTSPLVGFQGCMRHLQVNSMEYMLFDDALDGRNVEECVTTDPCSYEPCRNGGTCSVSPDGTIWSCDCPLPYDGVLCERLVDHCDGSPCHAGATCVSLDEDFLCLCPYGRQGIVCDEVISITRPSFGGSVSGYMPYIRYARVLNWDFLLTLRLKFTVDDDLTAIRSNLMLFSGQRGEGGDGDDYLAVGIQDGYLWFQFDVGSGAGVLRSPQPIDLSAPFHTLQIGRHRREGWMQLDNQVNVSGTTQGPLIGLNTYRDLYVGGHDTTEIHFLPDVVDYAESFKGCIYDLEINSGLYGSFVAPGNPPGQVDVGLNVGQCGQSECALNECENEATCIDLGASYICNCTDGWKGPLCGDVITVCDDEHPTPHDCSEGSICTPLPQGFECQCPLGKTGALCNEDDTFSDPLFESSMSYMSFARTTNLRFETEILMEFKPLTDTGLLFYIASQLTPYAGDFLAVSLVQGFLELRYSLDGKGEPAAIRTASRVNIMTDTWYTIEISRVNQNGILRFGDEQLFRRAPGNLISLDINTDIFIGGTPSLDTVNPMAVEGVVTSYQGCIRRVVVNGEELELTISGALEGLNVGDCDGTGCGYNVCRNNGTCLPIGGSTQDFTCQCHTPFTGPKCEDSIYCVNHQCMNNAICIPDTEAQTYICGCSLGFQGTFCEQSVNITSARFTSSSHLYFQDTNFDLSNKTMTTISFNFSTSSNQGLILWNGEPITTGVTDYLGIGVENGFLKISINLGHDSYSDIQHSAFISDDQWHAVIIIRSSTLVRVYVDGGQPLVTDIGGSFSALDTEGQYYLGGFGLSTSISRATGALFDQGYTGCLRNLVISQGDQPINLMNADDALNVQSCS